MREIAEGVRQLPGLLPHLINAYLIETAEGEVLVDAGTRWTAGRTLRLLRGRRLALVALTHAHPDHQGAAAAVCKRHGVPLACHAEDAQAMEGTGPMRPDNAIVRFGHRLLSGPAHPVAVRWNGGEMVGEWQVVHAPGHTPGHVLFFRRRDRVVVCGDLLRNAALRHGGCRLVEPPHFFSADPLRNRASLRLLAELQPTLVCPGHGPAFHDGGAVSRLVEVLGRASPSPRWGEGLG
jgi:glyoxylase-like metal-dependent hydrolase (beta-lactamase superfamily II)